jgi:hypothetical protein
MKLCLLILSILLVFVTLTAENVDGPLSDLLGMGSFVNHRDGSYFLVRMYEGNSFPGADWAYSFVAHSALMELAMHDGYAEFNNSGDKAKFYNVAYLGAAYSNSYQDYVISIPVAEIIDGVDVSDMPVVGPEVILERVNQYLKQYGDIHIYSMFTEECY